MAPFNIRKAPKIEQFMRLYLNDPATYLFQKPASKVIDFSGKNDPIKEAEKSKEIFKKVVGSLFLDDPNLKVTIGDIPGAKGTATAPVPSIPGFDASDMRNLFKTVFEGNGQEQFDLHRSISWAYYLLWYHLKKDIDAGDEKEIKRKLRILWETEWERTPKDGIQLAKVFGGGMTESDASIHSVSDARRWTNSKTGEKLPSNLIIPPPTKTPNNTVPAVGVYWRENGLRGSEIKNALATNDSSLSAEGFTSALKSKLQSNGNVYRTYGSFRICAYFERHRLDTVGQKDFSIVRRAPKWLNEQVGHLTPNGFYWNRASNFPDRINLLYKDAEDRADKIARSLGIKLADMDVARSQYGRAYPGFPVRQHTWRDTKLFNDFDDMISMYTDSGDDGTRLIFPANLKKPKDYYSPYLDKTYSTTDGWRYRNFGYSGGGAMHNMNPWDERIPQWSNIEEERYILDENNKALTEKIMDPGNYAVGLSEHKKILNSRSRQQLWVASAMDPEIVQTSMHEVAWFTLLEPGRYPALQPSQALLNKCKKADAWEATTFTDDSIIWSPHKYNDGRLGYAKWMSNDNTDNEHGGKVAQLYSWDQDSAKDVSEGKEAWDNEGGITVRGQKQTNPLTQMQTLLQKGSAWGRAIGRHKNYNMFGWMSSMWYHGEGNSDRRKVRLTAPRFMAMLNGFYNFDPIFSRQLRFSITPSLSFEWTKWELVDSLYNIEYVSWLEWNTRDQGGVGSQVATKGPNAGLLPPAGLDEGRRLLPIFEVEWNYFFLQTMRLTSYFLSMFMEGIFSYGDDQGRNWLPFKDGDINDSFIASKYGKRRKGHGWDECTVSNFYKILVSTIYRAVFSFAEFEAEIEAIKKANDALSPDDPRVSEDRENVVLDNMQCFLLNTADVFAKIHQVDKVANKFRTHYLFTNVKGPSSNFANLIGFKPESTTAFLNLSSKDLAQLQPKIRLFKERVVYDTDVDQYGNASTGDQTGKVLYRNTYEVPILFDPVALGSYDVARITAAGGRQPGGGIQEIRFSQQGGQEIGNINETKEVEIKYFFNSIEDMFVNWPRYEINRKGNKIKSIKATYPFGKRSFGARTPSFDKNKYKIQGEVPYSSAAELFFAVPNQFLAEVPQGLVDLNSPSHAILLELGWMWSEPFGKNRRKGSVLRQLNEQKLSRTYKLSPTDTDFEFMETGAIKATVKYIAFSHHLNSLEENKLFPVSGIIAKEVKDNKDYQKHMKTINRIEKKWKANPNHARTAQDIEQYEKAKTAIDALIKAAKEKQSARYRNEQLQKFMRRLTEAGMVHRVYIPAPFLGQRSDNRVVRWYPYRNMTLFRRFKKHLADEGRRPDSRTRNRLNAIKEALKRGKKPDPNKKTGAKLPWDGPEWPIDFIYFGDLIHVLLEYNWINYGDHIEPPEKSGPYRMPHLKHIHFILGSIQIPVIKGAGFAPTWVSLCDLPIVVDFLGEFIVNNIATTENYNMTVSDFILQFFKDILYKYFDETCFITQQGLDRAKPEITWFDLMVPFTKSGKYDYRNDMAELISSFQPLIKSPVNSSQVNPPPLPRVEGMGRFHNKARFRTMFKRYETQIKKTNPASKKGKSAMVQFCFLGAHAIAEGTYSAKEDRKQNIHHFYMGRDLGPVKKIQFKSEQIKGMSTALLLGGTKQFKHAVDQSTIEAKMIIPRVFNADVTLVGNTLFETGQTFFVDPVLGTSLGMTGKKKQKGFNIIEQTGLGGYYYITKIDTIIAPGRYETVLEGKTDKSASRETVTQASFNPKDMEKKVKEALEAGKEQFDGMLKDAKDKMNPF